MKFLIGLVSILFLFGQEAYGAVDAGIHGTGGSNNKNVDQICINNSYCKPSLKCLANIKGLNSDARERRCSRTYRTFNANKRLL
eukprot:Pgem_evm1s16282